MNKIALRIGINRHWNHLYYQSLSYMDPRYPLPFWNVIKQDKNALRVLKGFYPLSKIEIHKTREVIDIYICRDRYVNYPLIGGSLLGPLGPGTASQVSSIGAGSPKGLEFARHAANDKPVRSTGFSSLSMHRALLNIFKSLIFTHFRYMKPNY